MQRYEKLYINGQRAPYRGGRSIEVVNASTAEVMGSIPAGTAEHAKRIARRLRTGQVDINGGRFNLLAPSAASSSRATAGSLASTGWRSFWRSSRCSSEAGAGREE